MEVCVRYDGGGGVGGGRLHRHICMNEQSPLSDWCTVSISPGVREKEEEKGELPPGPPVCFHEWPQQGETVPHCQVIWQKSSSSLFFFSTPPHVKFINISPSFLFFFFLLAPSECLRIRSCCQAVSCRGLNDPSRCSPVLKTALASMMIKQEEKKKVI